MALGGPLGALLGGLTGHIVLDRAPSAARRADQRQVAFATGLIALSAKMAKADGQVTSDEVNAFNDIFEVPPEEEAKVRFLYNLAKSDIAGYEHYAGQLGRMFKDSPGLLEDVLDALFHIALADGVVHPNELTFLKAVSERFGFTETEFRRIHASHVGLERDDPYAILGLTPDVSDEGLKRAYRRLARENHPDALIARGAPEEFVLVCEAKLAAINTAYEKIVEERRVMAV